MLTNAGLHIIRNPKGTFSYVGSIPYALGTEVKATRSDVMGGRAFKSRNGDVVTMKFPVFDTEEESRSHAESKGHAVQSVSN